MCKITAMLHNCYRFQTQSILGTFVVTIKGCSFSIPRAFEIASNLRNNFYTTDTIPGESDIKACVFFTSLNFLCTIQTPNQ